MSATPTPGRRAVFVAQLHRAAAQRGKLDPVYQELSDPGRESSSGCTRCGR